jgi:hypothetical protein
LKTCALLPNHHHAPKYICSRCSELQSACATAQRAAIPLGLGHMHPGPAHVASRKLFVTYRDLRAIRYSRLTIATCSEFRKIRTRFANFPIRDSRTIRFANRELFDWRFANRSRFANHWICKKIAYCSRPFCDYANMRNYLRFANDSQFANDFANCELFAIRFILIRKLSRFSTYRNFQTIDLRRIAICKLSIFPQNPLHFRIHLRIKLYAPDS